MKQQSIRPIDLCRLIASTDSRPKREEQEEATARIKRWLDLADRLLSGTAGESWSRFD
jgi:hypothetical protein